MWPWKDVDTNVGCFAFEAARFKSDLRMSLLKNTRSDSTPPWLTIIHKNLLRANNLLKENITVMGGEGRLERSRGLLVTKNVSKPCPNMPICAQNWVTDVKKVFIN